MRVHPVRSVVCAPEDPPRRGRDFGRDVVVFAQLTVLGAFTPSSRNVQFGSATVGRTAAPRAWPTFPTTPLANEAARGSADCPLGPTVSRSGRTGGTGRVLARPVLRVGMARRCTGETRGVPGGRHRASMSSGASSRSRAGLAALRPFQGKARAAPHGKSNANPAPESASIAPSSRGGMVTGGVQAATRATARSVPSRLSPTSDDEQQQRHAPGLRVGGGRRSQRR
jgi:hypothetical protein